MTCSRPAAQRFRCPTTRVAVQYRLAQFLRVKSGASNVDAKIVRLAAAPQFISSGTRLAALESCLAIPPILLIPSAFAGVVTNIARRTISPAARTRCAHRTRSNCSAMIGTERPKVRPTP